MFGIQINPDFSLQYLDTSIIQRTLVALFTLASAKEVILWLGENPCKAEKIKHIWLSGMM